MAYLTYAGIGSRRTPQHILDCMTRIAVKLHTRGGYLYTGGAPGADYAFFTGASSVGRNYTVFAPWNGYNGFLRHHPNVEVGVTDAALELAATFHPAWRRLSKWARLLHARNCYQILGPGLDQPVTYVICWTPDGAQTADETSATTGGTGQAIRLADHYKIPIYNLARPEFKERLSKLLAESGPV